MELLMNKGAKSILKPILQLIHQTNHLIVLSPYITNSEAIEAILYKQNFKLTLVVNFDIDILQKKAVDLEQLLLLLTRIINKGHNVYFDNDLHSKIYLSKNSAILGSANFTNNGLFRRKETCIRFEKISSPILFIQCEDYCREIIEEAHTLTTELIEEAIIDLSDKYMSK